MPPTFFSSGFPEMMDGRVKTLHPKIHGGLHCLRGNEEHRKAAEANGIVLIELVVVNLYPFEETVAKPGVTLAEAIEQIDNSMDGQITFDEFWAWWIADELEKAGSI